MHVFMYACLYVIMYVYMAIFHNANRSCVCLYQPGMSIKTAFFHCNCFAFYICKQKYMLVCKCSFCFYHHMTCDMCPHAALTIICHVIGVLMLLTMCRWPPLHAAYLCINYNPVFMWISCIHVHTHA